LAREPLLNSDPTWVGRYRVSARLGSGGMGVVYLGAAEDGRQVAVKVLRPQLAEDKEFRTRFSREVAALLRVKGVCTVRVIEADTTSAQPFLVTEYVSGPSLAEYIEARGPLSSGMLYGLATGLAEALTAIHEAGIVHRDLKPSNVLLSASGPKVIDFGIAQALGATALTRPGVTIGSTGYGAPEQVTGGPTGTAADVFAWGVTIAYAARGQPPFGSGSPENIIYRVLHTAPDLITVPAELRPLVAAALAKEPGNRPGARDLLDKLTRTAAQPVQATQTILARDWRPAEPAPAAGVSPVARPAPVSRPAKPVPEPVVAPDPFGETAETMIPEALRSTEPPRTRQGWPSSPAPGWSAPNGSAPKRPGRRRAMWGVLAVCLAFAVAAGGTVLGIHLAGHHKPGGGNTAISGTRSASPTAALPVLTAGTYTGIKPKEIDFSGDAGNIVTGITWSSWTATTAIGSGTSDIDSCVPSCAAAPTDLVTTVLMLSDPVNGRFTVIREMRNGTAEAFVYPNTWALGAS
jgi:serine/threonine protein kinase